MSSSISVQLGGGEGGATTEEEKTRAGVTQVSRWLWCCPQLPSHRGSQGADYKGLTIAVPAVLRVDLVATRRVQA